MNSKGKSRQVRNLTVKSSLEKKILKNSCEGAVTERGGNWSVKERIHEDKEERGERGERERVRQEMAL